MSSILKGLNESNSVYGHSDPDREYGAPATSYSKRGPYSHTPDDDEGNPFAEYERQQRMFAVGRAQKAAKEKAQRDSDHDRLASGTNEEQLDELSNEKLGQYKTAAASDAGKADKEGDYKRGDKRFSGIVKATKKQFANDAKTVKEAEGQKEFILYINNKPAAKYVDQLQAERDMAAVKRKHPQVRIELKHEVCDLETIKKINENQLMGNALIEAKSLLTQLDESTQQQVINALKKNVGDEKDAFKNVYPRVDKPKILGTQNRAKSAYYPPSKPPIKKLDKPLPESLGDELKSNSLQALQQVKQKLEQQRMADLEQWEKDFKQNTVAKFTARQPSFMQQQPKQVAKPNEKHSVLKARLAQLNKAIEKQAILDKMLGRLDNKGLLSPAIKSDTDTSMLVRDGASDNYVTLNQKLDKALEFVKNRLLTNKAAFAKPKAIDEAGTGLDIDRSIPGRTIARISGTNSDPNIGKLKRNPHAKKLPDFYNDSDDYQQWSGKVGASTHDDEEDTFDIDYTGDEDGELDENLHKWFKEKWVRFGPDGKIRGDCARGDDSEGKPKCLPQSKAHSLGKKGRASAASRKRREDPNPERSGKAINVNTKKKSNESVAEGVNDYLWHGSREEHDVLYPRQANDTGGAEGSNKNAVYATPSAKVAIAMGLTTPGSDTGMFPNDPQMVLFKGGIRKGQMVYLHKVPKDLFIKHNGREWYSKPGVEAVKPIEVVKVPVDKWLHLIRQATPKDLELQKKFMKEGVAEGSKNIEVGDKITWWYNKFHPNYEGIVRRVAGNIIDVYAPGSGSMYRLTKDDIRSHEKKGVAEQELDEACWKGYHKEGNKKMFGKTYPNCVKNTNEEQEHHAETCPHCGGEMVSEELMNEKKDACYYKVKSRYKVWPSAYASGALVKCRKKGASNWGNGGKSNESVTEDDADDVEKRMLTKIAKYKEHLAHLKKTDPEAYKREMEKHKSAGKVPPVSTFEDQGINEMDSEGYKGTRDDYEIGKGKEHTGKPITTDNMIKAAKKAWDYATEPVDAPDMATYKRNRAKNIANIRKNKGVAEDQLDEKWSQKYKDSINCSNPKGFSQKAHCAGKQKNESAILKGLK